MNEPALAPEPEEGLLHRVLGERLVAEDPVGEAVRGAADPVVELRERRLVRPRDERDERLVGEVSEVATAHRRRRLTRTASTPPVRPPAAIRFARNLDRTGLPHAAERSAVNDHAGVWEMKKAALAAAALGAVDDHSARRCGRRLRPERRHRLESP